MKREVEREYYRVLERESLIERGCDRGRDGEFERELVIKLMRN